MTAHSIGFVEFIFYKVPALNALIGSCLLACYFPLVRPILCNAPVFMGGIVRKTDRLINDIKWWWTDGDQVNTVSRILD